MTQDPDLEAVRLEREHEEGQRDVAQNESISLGERNKQLEASYESRKRDIEDDLAIKRREAEIEKQKIADETLESRNEKATLESGNAVLRGEKATLIATNDTLVEQNYKEEARKERLTTDNTTFANELADIKKQLETLLPELTQVQKSIAEGRGELANVTERKQKASDEHDEFIKKSSEEVSKKTKDYNDLCDVHVVKTKQIVSLDTQLADKTAQLNTATQKLSEVQTSADTIHVAADKRDKESNERLGNASRLEKLVDAKREQLMEIEKAFTTEHLARIGYKKLSE